MAKMFHGDATPSSRFRGKHAARAPRLHKADYIGAIYFAPEVEGEPPGEPGICGSAGASPSTESVASGTAMGL